METQPQSAESGTPTAERKVGILLALGIFFVPFVFGWLTLRKGHSSTAKILAFAWMGVVLLGMVFGDSPDKGPRTYQSRAVPQSEKAVPPQPAMKASASQLVSAYEANEIAADAQYKDQIVEISGIVGDIKKDIMDNMYVTIGTGKQYEIRQVQAFFDDADAGQLMRLGKGQRVTVRCRIDGLMMNVLARDCVLQ